LKFFADGGDGEVLTLGSHGVVFSLRMSALGMGCLLLL
jgi:hypothetical protein